MAEEVRRVQSRHRRVLGELNLSVEAMLMPTAVDNSEKEMTQEVHGTSTEELLPSVGPADDLSRVGCDMDSGFSGSSTASYRYVGETVIVFVCPRSYSQLASDAMFLNGAWFCKAYLRFLFEFNSQIGFGFFKKRNGTNERSGTDRRFA